ncbi:TPA: thymidylate kinase [Patescibacteria group bacterium]|nr:MAG: Thymidylate kinase [Parcubacteria group bacterium GW2011_GWF2_40_10]KKR47805.1 MAG: Thymidylate kinase [Parcubacteria group bacterium GW2011_GWA2_40_143]KKR60236.1 MAG: Thymidylate kinase [Parcubacteria group bacterium GW2011_GWC2_40_31]KKR75206.1 MAG: Thymidylate kinase [Parcubacteria group bacterium GW2011_GWB2_40_8]KKR77317.1 MAG: Thymidylate kinase [Parcubacteria group bacterium GW2011_GWE2_40_8]HBB56431.1 thymidylate kinase [Patescibacteria group bacterium]
MEINKKGKFIVIDGTDGSGKKTQTGLLEMELRKQGRNVKTIDFPQYEKNFFGKMVGRYLSGEFGGASEVSPYLASILYAGDRFETKEKIEKWLKEGSIVISDRYVSSNQIHQGGKIKDGKKRKEFLKWLDELEYGVFKLPKPDTIIYLDMPLDVSLRLLGNKSAQDRKKYLNGKKDIHESDSRHLEDAKKNAIEIVKKSNNWIKINCAKRSAPLKPEEISKIILEKLKFVQRK